MSSDNKFPPFDIGPLKRLSHVLSDEEEALIRKWGHWAEQLATGRTLPTNEKQQRFLRICRGEEKPIRTFELAWLLYVQLVKADAELSRLDNERQGLFRFHQTEVARLEAEISNLTALLKKLQAKVARYEKELGIPEPANRPKEGNRGALEVCPVCGGDGGAKGECYKCDGTGWVSPAPKPRVRADGRKRASLACGALLAALVGRRSTRALGGENRSRTL